MHLGIADERALRAAFDTMGVATVAVQPMVTGRAEAILGVSTSGGLGPMLVAGLGGIYAEALHQRMLWPVPATRQDITVKLATSALGLILRDPRWPWQDSFDALQHGQRGAKRRHAPLPDAK